MNITNKIEIQECQARIPSLEKLVGDLRFYAPTNDVSWGGTLSGLEHNVFNFFDLDVKQGSHIIDFGSNIGLVSLVCSKLYPQSIIHSFDACEWAIKCLKKTCEINQIANIIPYHACVTASSEEYIEFSHENTGPSCFVRTDLLGDKLDKETRGYKTKNLHIKDVLTSKEDISFMKMDIEGGEWEIFDYLYKNDLDFFKKPQKVHIEVHGERDAHGNAGEELRKKINKLKSAFANEQNYIGL